MKHTLSVAPAPRTYPAPENALVAQQVAPSLWAVYDPEELAAPALGHVDRDGLRFHVALEGESLEPYSFRTLGQALEWFAEYAFALTLGSGSRT